MNQTPITASAETPQMILAAMAETIEQQLLPLLEDASARAAAASMLQVLAQLSITVAWDPAPLAERLRVRREALPLLATPAELLADTAGAADAVALERALRACDAWVAAQVPADDAPPPTPALEHALLAYGRAAAEVDLRFMTPSHLGKLTRRAAPAAAKA